MRRGGKWSWKWFFTNAAAWFAFLATVMQTGDIFGIFAKLKSYGAEGFIGLAVISIILAPLSYLFIRVLNDQVNRRLDQMAKEEQKLSRYCHLVVDEKRFKEHQMRIIIEANEFIYATGSRSRNKEYLGKIEARLNENLSLKYTRILFGEIKRNELREHCSKLAKQTELASRVTICEIKDLNNHTETFFVANEKEALMVIPSLNSISGFDTGLVLTGTYHKKVKNILNSYTKAASNWSC